MSERWRPVLWGTYEVTRKGQVRRAKRTKGARVGRALSCSEHSAGYLVVNVCIGGISRVEYVHRLVARAFLGPCPRGKQVNHIDGDKKNNDPSNLEYVTHRQNAIHAVRTGLRRYA